MTPEDRAARALAKLQTLLASGKINVSEALALACSAGVALANERARDRAARAAGSGP